MLAFNGGWIWPVQLASPASPTEAPEVADGIQEQISPHKSDNQHLLGVFGVIVGGHCVSMRLIERVSGKGSLFWVISALLLLKTVTRNNSFSVMNLQVLKGFPRWKDWNTTWPCTDTVLQEIIHEEAREHLDVQDFYILCFNLGDWVHYIWKQL